MSQIITKIVYYKVTAKVEGKMCNGKPIISEWVVMELTPHWYGLLDDLNFTKMFKEVSGKEKFKSLECGDNLILDGTITIEIDPSNLTYNKTWLSEMPEW